jgi:hypothetical protein
MGKMASSAGMSGNCQRMTPMTPQKFFRRKASSQYLFEVWGLNYAPSTLAKLAVLGGGPPFRRAGRTPLYAKNDLDEWVASKLSPAIRSTSELSSAIFADANISTTPVPKPELSLLQSPGTRGRTLSGLPAEKLMGRVRDEVSVSASRAAVCRTVNQGQE